ncbi:MAG: hypothetical protein ABIG92_02995 [Candidatus Omnitrophota bacterium]
MKKLPNILLAIGIILFALAIVGKFTGNPVRVLHYKIVSMIAVSNTILLLAIAAKLFEKK